MNRFHKVYYTNRNGPDWLERIREILAQVLVTKTVMTEESNIPAERPQSRQQKNP